MFDTALLSTMSKIMDSNRLDQSQSRLEIPESRQLHAASGSELGHHWRYCLVVYFVFLFFLCLYFVFLYFFLFFLFVILSFFLFFCLSIPYLCQEILSYVVYLQISNDGPVFYCLLSYLLASFAQTSHLTVKEQIKLPLNEIVGEHKSLNFFLSMRAVLYSDESQKHQMKVGPFSR